MNPDTLEALKAAYAAMLRERSSSWRIMNQTLYCEMRDVIAEATGTTGEYVQNTMECYVALTPR